MEKPLEEFKIKKTPFDSHFTIKVYEQFVTVEGYLSSTKLYDASMRGGVQAERIDMNNLLREVFPLQGEKLKIFSTELEAGLYQDSISFEIYRLTGSFGSWFKTALFLIDEQNYEDDLDKTLKFITESIDFYYNPRANHQKIAKSISSKYFK